MSERKVISRKNLPTHLPVMSTALAIILMDYYNAPQWVWGVVITLLAIMWIGGIVAVIKETQIDIMEKWRGAPLSYKEGLPRSYEEAMKRNSNN